MSAVNYRDRSRCNYNKIGGIFAGLSKALNNFDHLLLIAKLHCGEFSLLLLKLTLVPDKKDVYGTPRGSVLGPFFFNI